MLQTTVHSVFLYGYPYDQQSDTGVSLYNKSLRGELLHDVVNRVDHIANISVAHLRVDR